MKKKGFLTAACTIAIAFAAMAASQNADASSGLPACSATISACGCVVTSPGDYSVSADLTATSSSADCIDIKAKNVNLNTEGYTISGPGAVGINILKSAKNANVQFSLASNLNNYSLVTGFETGIQVAGANTVLYNFQTSSNSGDGLVFTKTASGSHAADFDASGNGGNGITINGASNLALDDFDAGGGSAGIVMTKSSGDMFEDFDVDLASGGNGLTVTSSKSNTFSDFDAYRDSGNGVEIDNSKGNNFKDFGADSDSGNGVVINHSKNIAVSGFETDGAGQSGVVVSASTNIRVVDGDAYDNGVYGVQLQNSNKSLLAYLFAYGDAQTGVYVGCAVKNGPTASGCSSIGPSNSNRVNAIYAGYDTGANLTENYGVAVDLGDSKNLLTGLTITGATTDDAIDENSGCDSNSWFNVGATTVSPSSCIPVSLPVAAATAKGAFSGFTRGHTAPGN
jgi:hypothetical protein